MIYVFLSHQCHCWMKKDTKIVSKNFHQSVLYKEIINTNEFIRSHNNTSLPTSILLELIFLSVFSPRQNCSPVTRSRVQIKVHKRELSPSWLGFCVSLPSPLSFFSPNSRSVNIRFLSIHSLSTCLRVDNDPINHFLTQ